MIELKDIVIDCAHPASVARFWASVLDGYAVAPYDDAELARLAEMGIDDPDDDPGVVVEGPGPFRLYFQQVPEPKPGKNRVHFDLTASDPVAAIDHVLGLGGSVVQRHEDWVVLADPEGNEFCIMTT